MPQIVSPTSQTTSQTNGKTAGQTTRLTNGQTTVVRASQTTSQTTSKAVSQTTGQTTSKTTDQTTGQTTISQGKSYRVIEFIVTIQSPKHRDQGGRERQSQQTDYSDADVEESLNSFPTWWPDRQHR